MNDAERYTIPSRLDDPERWLFWTMDEAAVLMGPAMLGLAANAFVPGLRSGSGGGSSCGASSAAGGPGSCSTPCTGFCPGRVLGLKGAPGSHRRRLAG